MTLCLTNIRMKTEMPLNGTTSMSPQTLLVIRPRVQSSHNRQPKNRKRSHGRVVKSHLQAAVRTDVPIVPPPKGMTGHARFANHRPPNIKVPNEKERANITSNAMMMTRILIMIMMMMMTLTANIARRRPIQNGPLN